MHHTLSHKSLKKEYTKNTKEYNKEYSHSLKRNVWYLEDIYFKHKERSTSIFNERPLETSHKNSHNDNQDHQNKIDGGVVDTPIKKKTYKIYNILKLKGTRKNNYYVMLLNIVKHTVYTHTDPVTTYISKLVKHIDDQSIYQYMYQIVYPESHVHIKHSTPSNENALRRSKNRARKVADIFKDQVKNKAHTKSKPQSYLDYGCGTGDFVEYIGKELSIPATHIYGTDIVRYPTLNKFHFSLIENGKTTFPDNKFSFITCFMVLHHIPDEILSSSIDEIYRILEPGGIFLIREHNVYKDSEIITSLLDIMHDLYDYVLDKDLNWRDTEYYAKYRSSEDWDALLENSGFKVTSAEPSIDTNIDKNPILQYYRCYTKNI